MFTEQSLLEHDAVLASIITAEERRQEEHVELIASENYVSPQVLMVQGSVLTNKYAEGYPGKRYYGGCEFVDQAEELAIVRAQTLFHAAYVNVQPHSGSQANAAVYAAMLQPGDTVVGMSLAHGGHLTHGSPVNFSGKLYKFHSYGLHPETEEIDYDAAYDVVMKHKPRLIVTGFSAYSRIVDWAKFREMADAVGAYLMADIAHVAGLVATNLYPSPVNIADVTTTTTHKTLRGPRGGMIMAKANPELEKKLNSAVFPGGQGGPLMHVIAAKACAFHEALQPDFKTYQEQTLKNARVMAEVIKERGYRLVSGGTDNHLMLIDLIGHQLTGKEAESLLGKVNITVNKNAVPNDPSSPFITSGLRIGTPAVTTRGFKETQCEQIANLLIDLLNEPTNEARFKEIKQVVHDLCRAFPVYSR